MTISRIWQNMMKMNDAIEENFNINIIHREFMGGFHFPLSQAGGDAEFQLKSVVGVAVNKFSG